jgi:hypothetical protein
LSQNETFHSQNETFQQQALRLLNLILDRLPKPDRPN